MIDVCVCGARGRMGSLLVELIDQAQDLSLAGALERPGHPDLGTVLGKEVQLTGDPGEAMAGAQVILDFSLPATVCEHVAEASSAGIPFVTGTTGFTPEQNGILQKSSERIPLVVASNMSRGVHLLVRLVEQAAVALADHDAEIFELHHKNKVDAPSGTALKLSEAIRSSRGAGKPVYAREGRRDQDEIGMASARGGDVVGEHQVMFFGPGEQFSLVHRATTREHFCSGALEAVRFASRAVPGLYGMNEVFGG